MAKTTEEKKVAKRESAHRYYEAHREQRLIQMRKYHKSHPEQARAQVRAYNATHRKEKNAATRKWCKNHPDAVRAANKEYNVFHRVQIGVACIRRTYKVSIEEAARLYAVRQTGICAACKGNRSNRVLDIDHDHDTNAVRGLLCHKCNLALGHMAENPEWLQNLTDYAQQARDAKRGHTNDNRRQICNTR